MKYKLKNKKTVELTLPSLKDRIRCTDMLDYDISADGKVSKIHNSLATAVEWCRAVLPKDFDINTLSNNEIQDVALKAQDIAKLGN